MGFFNKKEEPQDFSDVQSGNSSTAAENSKAQAADFSDVEAGHSSTAPTSGERMYVVKSGDSLSKIALREYGNANKWRHIWEANKDKVKDPDLIHPGQELKIPAA